MLIDTSAVLAAIDADDGDHTAVRTLLDAADPPFRLSPFVLSELDYLARTRLGTRPQRLLLADVARGSYTLTPFDEADVGSALGIMERYGDLRLSLADASIVVLAARHGDVEVATLDERHFRVLPGPGGRPFRLLPADAA